MRGIGFMSILKGIETCYLAYVKVKQQTKKGGMDNESKLFIIKSIHTLIWVFFVSIIIYILYSGLTDNVTLYTWMGIGLIIGEGLILLLFKMSCPLTVIARNYSESQKDNFDIFLPNWLAKHNKLIFTSIFVIALIIVMYRSLT